MMQIDPEEIRRKIEELRQNQRAHEIEAQACFGAATVLQQLLDAHAPPLVVTTQEPAPDAAG